MSNQVFLSDINLASRYGITRPSIWRWVKSRKFPQPVKLSPGCTRWRLSDVEAWEVKQGGAG